MLGKLSWDAIPFNQPIPLITSIVVILVILAVLGLITVKGWWPYLWSEWITSVDHKRIGVMYCTLALVMLIRGFADAIMMRGQQAVAFHSGGYLPPEHFDQIFSAHGTIMIFFVAMPFVIGLMNFAVPLQLGVRDVAFPTLNSVSFWLTASGVLLVNASLIIGEFSQAGWMGYPPLSELAFSPGVGVDYYLWSLQISGVGTLLTGVNFVTTILKLRAPGMTYMRMPIFCWTALASNLLIVAAFPVLTATFAMLLLDRYLGFHFFTTDMGGNAMMYVNLFWAWGHPEVYILILPAFGVFSEVVSTFSGKPLFGYRSMVIATLAICILSFMVWLHHFFTMGAGADVNAIFGVMSMIIAIPTGVKIFNWLFTMWGGRVRFELPMLWAVAFMFTFAIGGMTGVLLAVPPADFVLHNSLFLVAHFHNVIIGGVLFGAFAGYTYWFPKAFGFRLEKRWGTAAFWFWLVGFYVAWVPRLCRRSRRHDAAPAALRRPRMAAVADRGGGRRRPHPVRHLLPDHADRRQRPRALRLARPHRRPVGRADARMVHRLAAAGVQLRRPAGRDRRGGLLGDQAARHRHGEALAAAALRGDRDAGQQPDRLRRRLLRRPHRIRADLAHLVDGGGRRRRRLRDLRRLRLARLRGIRDPGRRGEKDRHAEARSRARAWWRDGSPAFASSGSPSTRSRSGRGRESGRYDGPPPKRIVTTYGFWVFLLSDFVMFSAFYATFAVLSHSTAGGPGPLQLFNLKTVAAETAFLLLSSFVCGLAMIAAGVRNMLWTQIGLVVTGLLGLGFLGLEVNEFARMIAEGNGPDRSAFLSAFFALVGCHGLHVTIGLLWLGTMMAQFFTKGFRPEHPAPRPVLRALLARPRHHLGRHLHQRLSSGRR